MLKKMMMAAALGLALGTAVVFAEHPGGLGIGGVFGMGVGKGGLGGYNAGLSLKAPGLPVFWAINAHINNSSFGVGGSGDYYIIDKTLIPGIGLGWYLGIGGYVGTLFTSNDRGLWAGFRLPVGLSWIPVDWFELFLEIAPNLGLNFLPNFEFPHGSFLNPAIGFRFWL
jgi:hypothetical protein